MTQDTQEQATSSKRKISTTEKIVGSICALGVLVATWVALEAAGLPLFSRDAMEVVADAWTKTATVGVIVALLVATVIGVFVTILSKATLGHDAESAEVETTPTEAADH